MKVTTFKNRAFATLCVAAPMLLQSCGSLSGEGLGVVEDGKLRGHYIHDEETNGFRPCYEGTVYEIAGTGQSLLAIKEGYRELATEPYEEVYVLISGEIVEPSEGNREFAGKYHGKVRVDELHQMAKKSDDQCK